MQAQGMSMGTWAAASRVNRTAASSQQNCRPRGLGGMLGGALGGGRGGC
jgi:hypothetical protein